jgi:mono/diheme cytochrome c family protein/predicted  nucleic acid-binding Zn-ribbon protein
MNDAFLRFSSLLAMAAVVIAAGLARVAVAEDAAKKVTYVDHVQPIFRQHCFACHGPDQKKNDLALNTYSAAMAGGASGDAVIAGDISSSYLWLLVNHEMEPSMPPGGAKLPQAELDLIKAWIEGGLLEKGDSVAQKPKKSAVATFTPTADNKPEGEPAMPQGVLKEPVIHTPNRGAPTALATSPWAPLAAIGSAYQISLYNTDTGELLGVLPFVEGSPYVLRFSRDGSILMAGGGKSAALGIVALFDVKTGRRLTTIGDELDAVIAADIRADHGLVALGGPRKTVRVYKVADGSLAYEITKHTDWVTALEFSPDGKLLATADRSAGLFVWDAETGRERGDLRGHTEAIGSMSWRGDSAVLASTSEDDTVRLWKVADSTQIKSWSAHVPGSNSVHFARDGQLVTSGRDAAVKTWKPDGAAIREVGKLEDLALAARFTHDGKRVAAADWRGNVRVFDAEKGEAVATLDPNPPTIDARLASTETEVNQLRAAAEAAQQQLAAAQSALEQAQKDAAAKMQMHSETSTKLGSAEQQLAAAAKEKAALVEAQNAITAEMTTAKEELAAAEAAAEEKFAEREESKAGMTKQEAVVNEIAAQVAELQKKLEAAQAALKSLADAHAAKEQEASTAESKVGDAQSKIADLERRQQELEAIRKLREQFGAK